MSCAPERRIVQAWGVLACFSACEHGRVRVTRLVTPGDAPALAELVRVNRDFLAPWEPARSEDYFTVGGQRAIIGDGLARYRQGSALPHVILDRTERVKAFRRLARFAGDDAAAHAG